MKLPLGSQVLVPTVRGSSGTPILYSQGVVAKHTSGKSVWVSGIDMSMSLIEYGYKLNEVADILVINCDKLIPQGPFAKRPWWCDMGK